MKNFVFDLDDTLFREIDWVRSALRHCAELVGERYRLDPDKIFASFWRGLRERGRGKVFRVSLKEVGVEDVEELFPYLYYRYRIHQPDSLELMPGVRETLVELRRRGYKLGIITDGVLTAQMNKVRALGVEELVNAIVYTEVFGYEFRKPSTVPFKVIKRYLGEEGEFFYIGDNPDKDFIGAREEGYRTIMLKDDGNELKARKLDKNFLADAEIDNIRQLLDIT